MNFYLSYLKRFLTTIFGLFIFAFGIYLTLQGNQGLAPWDTLATGVTCHIPITYGQSNIMISIVILAVDLLLKEPIGFGSVLNALLIGVFADLFSALNLISKQTAILPGLLLLIAGMFVMAVGQFFYMSGQMGCGPRDAFLVGIGKRLSKLPIGAVQTIILVVVLASGLLLGAPLGIGTFLATVGVGTAMQIVFRFLHFEPRSLKHENLLETCSAFGKQIMKR